MRELTVSEYAEEQGISGPAVRKQIKKKLLKTGYALQNNKKILVILVDDKETMKETKEDKPLKPIQPEFQQDEKLIQLKVEQDNKLVEEILQMHKDYKSLASDYIKIAELAGQTRLLTDQTKKTEQDTEFWKTKFFEIQQEKLSLEKKMVEFEIKQIELEAQNTELKRLLQVEQDKNKSFWSKFR